MGAKRPGGNVLGAKRLGEEIVWGRNVPDSYESYDKYLILDMEAISLSLPWLLIDTFDSEKTYGINVRLQSISGYKILSISVGKEFKPSK